MDTQTGWHREAIIDLNLIHQTLIVLVAVILKAHSDLLNTPPPSIVIRSFHMHLFSFTNSINAKFVDIGGANSRGTIFIYLFV